MTTFGPRRRGVLAVSGAGVAAAAIAPVPADVDDMTVPSGYDWQPVIRWVDPMLPGGPAFDPEN